MNFRHTTMPRALIALAGWFGSTALAQTHCIWDADGAIPPDGNFDVAANWSPDVVPGMLDTALFNYDYAPFTVTMPSTLVSNANFLMTHGEMHLYKLGEPPFQLLYRIEEDLIVDWPGAGPAIAPPSLFLHDVPLYIDNRLIVDFGTVTATDGTNIDGHRVVLGMTPMDQGTLDLEDASDVELDEFLIVGQDGSGWLTLATGADTTCLQGLVAYNADSEGHVEVSGASSSLTSTQFLMIGRRGLGTLDLLGGEVINHDAYLGWASTAAGTATVTGDGLWTNTGSLYVGGSASAAAGSGRLVVGANGTVSVAETLKVWDTVELDEGWIEADVLEIAPGATFAAAPNTLTLVNRIDGLPTSATLGNLGLGWAGGASEALLVVDGGSDLDVNVLYVGFDPQTPAEVGVSNGSVNANAITIGLPFGAYGELNIGFEGPGSVSCGLNPMWVGAEGYGQVVMVDESTLVSGATIIGAETDAWGRVVLNSGTWDVFGNLTIGERGIGNLDIIDNGTPAVDVGGSVFMGLEGGQSEIYICGAGARLEIGHYLYAGFGGTCTVRCSASSTVIVGRDFVNEGWFANQCGPPESPPTPSSPTGVFRADNIINRGSFTLTTGNVETNAYFGDGDIDLLGGRLLLTEYDGDLLNQGTTLAAKATDTDLWVHGDFTQTDGAVELELTGSHALEFEQLLVSGHASFGGRLEIRLANGFVPLASDDFPIAAYDSHDGVFENAVDHVCTADRRGRFTVTYDGSVLWLRDFVYCPGDIDCSADVGFGDVVSILAAWGPCGGCPEDLNGDGDVGFADLIEVLTAWGPCD